MSVFVIAVYIVISFLCLVGWFAMIVCVLRALV